LIDAASDFVRSIERATSETKQFVSFFLLACGIIAWAVLHKSAMSLRYGKDRFRIRSRILRFQNQIWNRGQEGFSGLQCQIASKFQKKCRFL
jgi:hypothetical protein